MRFVPPVWDSSMFRVGSVSSLGSELIGLSFGCLLGTSVSFMFSLARIILSRMFLAFLKATSGGFGNISESSWFCCIRCQFL